MALFVQLDTAWPDDDRVIEAGLDGAGLHATAMCLAKRLETDGWIGRRLLARYGGTDELTDRLISVGLLRVDGDRVQPAGWLDRNPSQDAINAKREAKAEAAWRGNHARWDHDGPVDECTRCKPPAHVIARCDRSSRTSDPAATRVRSPETESEPYKKSESETSTPAKSQDYSQPATPAEPTAADQQKQLKTAALVSRTIEPPAGAIPDAYAAGIAREINTGPDPTRRDAITRRLAAGDTPEQIAASWTETDEWTRPTVSPEAVQEAAERPRNLERATADRLARQRAEKPVADPRQAITEARAAIA